MKKSFITLGSVAAGVALLSMSILPAFAQAAVGLNLGVSASATVGGGVNANVGAGASVRAKLISNAQARADQEITRRVNALNALSTRVNAMVKLSADEKNSLSAEITSQISLMNTLQAQIATDAAAQSTSSLKADIQSITKSYRIFALIIPQGSIAAASDRIVAIVGLMSGLSTKLQARIVAAQASGTNVTAMQAAYADFTAKGSDADTQAQAAVTETQNLKPDNGDATVMASNTAALKDARTKIHTAQADLVAARKDAGTIIKALAAIKVSASSTVSASGSSQ